jgi:hypothetical protein
MPKRCAGADADLRIGVGERWRTIERYAAGLIG